MFLTYRYRMKDGSRSRRRELRRMARAVNRVWNFCNETQLFALKHNKKWPKAFDLNNLVAGSSKILGLHSQTIQAVCERYAASREAKHKPRLRWRGKQSLSWVPFKASCIKRAGNAWVYLNRRLPCWLHRNLPETAVIKSGSFNEDACGKWWINVTVEMPDVTARSDGDEIGIDLGLKDVATLSTGHKIENPKYLLRMANKLARAQRANKKSLAARTHRKIANARKDHIHKASRRIADAAKIIVVGDVSSAKMVKTCFAKSVLDAGWASFKEMLRYKATGRGASFVCVAEHGTTRMCSRCGITPDSSPKGMGALGIREWTCSGCGARHDRDVNAARNILRRGLATLAEGAPPSGWGAATRRGSDLTGRRSAGGKQ